MLERLIHGFLKLRVLVRALYGIVGVSPYLLRLLGLLTQSHTYWYVDIMIIINFIENNTTKPALAIVQAWKLHQV